MARDPELPTTEDLRLDSLSFPRRFRLLNAADYDRVFRRAQRSRDRFFTVLYSRNGQDFPRLGLAIAKKRVRRAVMRNRIKRVIRESFRRAKNQLLGTDIVIMARDEAEQASNTELFRSLENHWRNIGRYLQNEMSAATNSGQKTSG